MDTLIHDIQTSKTIVFVCSGNIIRSAFAELYASYLIPKYRFKSLGTQYYNSKIYHRSKEELLKRGVDREIINKFHPTHIDEFEYENMDEIVFFSMTKSHKKDLDSHFGKHIKSYFLMELLNQNSEIEDPYFSGNFDKVYSMLDQCIVQLAKYCID